MNPTLKFGGVTVIILGTLGWLAVGGMNESKSYYKEIPEVHAMGAEAVGKRLRVAGDVEQGSVKRHGTAVHFTIVQVKDAKRTTLNVIYDGKEPLPDTFKDGAQALADGRLQSDGTFHANRIQAKCASKYEAKPGQVKPGNEPVYAPAAKS
jgi:cytochrome c-type biogenesis protein CcmE